VHHAFYPLAPAPAPPAPTTLLHGEYPDSLPEPSSLDSNSAVAAAPFIAGAGAGAGAGITVGMTTCRRLQHFLASIDAFQRALSDTDQHQHQPSLSATAAEAAAGAAGHLPGAATGGFGLVRRVVVVDDGSTDEDRQAMLRAQPRVHYVFKDPPPTPTPTPGAAAADADADAPHGGGDGAVGAGAGAGAEGEGEGAEARRRRYAQWAAEHGVASLQVAPSPSL